MKAKEILETMSENFKNKTELAKIYSYVGDIENAVINYFKGGSYQKAYKYLPSLSE